jgi:SAM-dependent methyltransferase
MSSLFYKRKECSACHTSDLDNVLPLVATPPGDKYLTESQKGESQEPVPLDLYQCRNCGLTQLAYIVHPEALYGDYLYESSISLGLANHFKQYAEDVVKGLRMCEGEFAVDIGSNDGTLLTYFKNAGMRVLGIEPSPAGETSRKSGVETLTDFFSEELGQQVRDAHGPAKVVAANNVFANIDDLHDVVSGVKRLLDSDGVFVFETFYLVDVLQRFLPETIFHEHLFYFSLHPLQTLLSQHGMEVFDVKRVVTKGGSLRGLVQLSGGGREITDRVGETLNIESEMGILTPEVFADFATKLGEKKSELTTLLGKLKEGGKSIAGYGASVGVTTLLYQFDIAKYLDFLVDDNPAKHHRLSPGDQLPVLPSQVLYESKPDYVLIMAWAYAQPIMGKHEAFSAAGGHFIIPLPETKVI